MTHFPSTYYDAHIQLQPKPELLPTGPPAFRYLCTGVSRALHAQHPKAELYCLADGETVEGDPERGTKPKDRDSDSQAKPTVIVTVDFPSPSLEHQAFFLSPKSTHTMAFRPP